MGVLTIQFSNTASEVKTNGLIVYRTKKGTRRNDINTGPISKIKEGGLTGVLKIRSRRMASEVTTNDPNN